jgi:hypothetical protein
MILQHKIELHKNFWQGKNHSLILIPRADLIQYDINNYHERFYDSQKMWKSEILRTEGLLGWPTDGIPTVRPNLGTIFVPAIAGQGFQIQEGQMPWPGEPLGSKQIESIRNVDIENVPLMQLAIEFYKFHHSMQNADVAAYLPDTQGVFDITHLLYGDAIFYDIADPEKKRRLKDVLQIVLELYIKVSELLKITNHESHQAMIHGHGTPQGVYFPSSGVRISEDTATLLSPAMIEEFVMPYVEMAAKHFGSAFVHYCGKHEILFEQLATSRFVTAIDLGNPEMYDTKWLFEKCSQTQTVFFGKVAALKDETWQSYITRIADLVSQTGVRCILRPVIFPSSKSECMEMLQMWHHLTTI